MKNRISLFNKYGIIFSYLLTAFFTFLFISYMVGHLEQFKALLRVPFRYIAVIAILTFPFKITTGLRFKTMMDLFKVRLKLKEWFGLSCISAMVNYVLPAKAGIVTQALYLKKIHRFDYSKFATYLGSLALFTVAVNSALGLLFLIIYYLTKGSLFFGLFLAFFIIFLLSMAAIFAIPFLSRLKIKLDLFYKIIDGFKMLKGKRAVLLQLFLIQICDTGITGLRIFFSYKAIGVDDMGILPAFMVGLFASISALINLTPANIGIRELFITISSVMVGRGAANGLMASLIDRGVGAIITFIAGLIFVPVLMRKSEFARQGKL